MTDCNDSLRELQRFLDGDLDDVECGVVLAHLDECIECYHAYDFQAELRQVVAAKCGGDPLPDGLLDRLAEALAAECAGAAAGEIATAIDGDEAAAPVAGS